ncbi:MAG: hypothetical protein ABJG68_09585 [Crocinitomicaceae bacterium]
MIISKKIKKIAGIFFILFIVSGLVTSWYHSAVKEEKLKEFGVTTGRLDSISPLNSAVYVYYSFVVNEKKYFGSQQVSQYLLSMENELIGNEVKVKYSLEDPNYSELTESKFQ